jgi:dTDP-4-dehydrorhamnose 3,5-epimerase
LSTATFAAAGIENEFIQDNQSLATVVGTIRGLHFQAPPFAPAGFAHGCCTLEPDTELFYRVDALYSADHDRGVNWADRTWWTQSARSA